MSKRMVDLKVVDGKITSIDGHEIAGSGGGGGGEYYCHSVEVNHGGTIFYFNIYNKNNSLLTLESLKTALVDKKITCSGFAYNNDRLNHVTAIYLYKQQIYASEYAFEGISSHIGSFIVDSTYKITDIVSPA